MLNTLKEKKINFPIEISSVDIGSDEVKKLYNYIIFSKLRYKDDIEKEIRNLHKARPGASEPIPIPTSYKTTQRIGGKYKRKSMRNKRKNKKTRKTKRTSRKSRKIHKKK